MTNVLIQFHWTPEEAVSFFHEFLNQFPMLVYYFQLSPFVVRNTQPGTVPELLLSLDRPANSGLVLALQPLDVSKTTGNRFRDSNPNRIEVIVGRLTRQGLEESSLSVRSECPSILSCAQKLCRKIKAATVAGAWAQNPDTGAMSFIRSHRYTKGAEEKCRNGASILPVAGKCLYLLANEDG